VDQGESYLVLIMGIIPFLIILHILV